jgi:hypothetical protein
MFTHSKTNVGDGSPTLLFTADHDLEFSLYAAGGAQVFIGDDSVDETTGFPVVTNNLSLKAAAGDSVYAITDSGNTDVFVLINHK